MNIPESKVIAQQWLGSQTKLHYCAEAEIPKTLYNFDADKHHVLYVEDPQQSSVGSGRYIAVNKIDGSVTDLGFHGE